MGELARVKIEYGNGALGQAITSNDGLLCLAVVGCDGNRDGIPIGELLTLTSVASLDELGGNEDANKHIYDLVRDFYSEAQEGTKVYLIAYNEYISMSSALDKDTPYLVDVLRQTKGEIRGLIVSQDYRAELDNDEHKDRYILENGFISGMSNAIYNAQRLGEWATEVLNAPIFTLIEGFYFDGQTDISKSNLLDLTKSGSNRVGVVVGTKEYEGANQAIGIVAGRLASNPVHRNIGRVKDGAINASQIYYYNETLERMNLDALAEKGYIFFRNYTGLGGYYIADDYLATFETDDYNQLTRRRTVDKAYRIANACLLEELLDEIPVNEDGSIMETTATAIEQKVINAIALNMTSRGELSANPEDSNDNGVKCYIDRTVNILATSQIKITLRVRPFGYARYIDVLLDFQVTTN